MTRSTQFSIKTTISAAILAVGLFTLPIVSIASAHHNTITQNASCSGYTVKADYVGGNAVRRVITNVDFTLNGVKQDIDSDWRGLSNGFNIFTRTGTGSHDVKATGTVKLYSCDDTDPDDDDSNGSENLWTDGSVYKCDSNDHQHNSDDGWELDETDTFNLDFKKSSCPAPTPTATPTNVPTPTATPTAVPTPTATPTPQRVPVTICHATHSDEVNPYNQITVDDDAVDGDGNSDHNRDDHQDGEDIIPPGPWDVDGRNWTTQGQAIWNNGCNIPQPTPTATPTAVPTPTNQPTPTPTDVPEVTPTPTDVPTPTPTNVPEVTPTPTDVPEVTPTQGPTPTDSPKVTPTNAPAPTEPPRGGYTPENDDRTSLSTDEMCKNNTFVAVFDVYENNQPIDGQVATFSFMGEEIKVFIDKGRAKATFPVKTGTLTASAPGHQSQSFFVDGSACPAVILDPKKATHLADTGFFAKLSRLVMGVFSPSSN